MSRVRSCQRVLTKRILKSQERGGAIATSAVREGPEYLASMSGLSFAAIWHGRTRENGEH